MALHIYYFDNTQGLVELTGYIKWGEGNIRLTMTAEESAVDTDSITLDDPNGELDLVGLNIVYAMEDAASFERVWTGWLWVRHHKRGDYYRTGTARVIEAELQNINQGIYQYVMTGEDDSRPAESDVERIQWLMTTNEATPIFDTTTYVFTDRPVDMDANPSPGYNGQTFDSVISDCAQQSGKNHFMLDVDVGGGDYKQAFWYGHDDLDEFVSDATISNVDSEVDGVTVFWADVSATMDRDPSRIWSGLFANYDGGWVYEQRADTITDFHHRDTTASFPNVKTSAKASARAIRMLDDWAQNGEEDAVTVTIYSLLPSQASVFRAGHRVNGVKFTHFPGWETGRDVRIVRRTLIDQSEQFYSMELDLLPIGPAPVPASCSMSVAAAESTAVIYDYPSGGPMSLPVSAASFDSAMQIMFWAYTGPSMGLGGCAPLVVGGGWTLLDQESDLGASIWVATGYLSQPTMATPSNMTVSAMCTGGGPPEGIGHAFAFPSSSTAPVQQSALTGSGNATMPGTPTPGNILYSWWIGTGGGADTGPWIADGGTILLDNEFYPGTGVFVTLGIRCVTEDDTTTIRIPSGSHANVGGVSEWLP